MNLLTIFAPMHAAAAKKLESSIREYTTLQYLQDRCVRLDQTRNTPANLDAKLALLHRQVTDLRQVPTDITEWAELLILLLSAAHAANLDAGDLLRAGCLMAKVHEDKEGI